jgi:SAM-dependent methyltransferase
VGGQNGSRAGGALSASARFEREIDVAAVEQRLGELARTILDAKRDDYDDWLYRYCGELASPDDVARYLRYQLDYLRLGGRDPRGASVLDAGCGFGLTLLVMGLLGAERLRGIDNYPGMVQTIRAYQPLLPPELGSKLEVTDGDVAAMPYGDGEFDIVLSIEAISHYLDVEGFVGEAARVLRPGGVMVIADGNNGLNRSIRNMTHAIWDAFESGPDGTELHGHTVGVSYRTKRARILAERVPQIGDADRERLAERTAGMVEAEVVMAGERFAAAGELPEPALRPGEVPVSPEGQVIERLFDPYELARQIDAAGFESHVYGYWGGAQGNPALRAANTVLQSISRATIYTARSFRIVSVRR